MTFYESLDITLIENELICFVGAGGGIIVVVVVVIIEVVVDVDVKPSF
jgi:hypothetical protein